MHELCTRFGAFPKEDSLTRRAMMGSWHCGLSLTVLGSVAHSRPLPNMAVEGLEGLECLSTQEIAESS